VAEEPVGALSSLESQHAIRVHRVQSAEAKLKECYRLRHRVYDALGYLEEPASRSASGIDMGFVRYESYPFRDGESSIP
jgi:hypothetical protein